jgi:2-methylcitrate dehydratase
LVAENYSDDYHQNTPLIDGLRNKMVVEEDKRYTKEYLEADKRSIANAVQIFFTDGTQTEKVAVQYPIGHRRRREEGIPVLEDKFKASLAPLFAGTQQDILDICLDQEVLENMAANEFMDLFVL